MLENYSKVFAKNVIDAIRISGLTLSEASEKSNLSVSFLSKIKHYERSISLYNAIKLAKLVNKSLDELCGFNFNVKERISISDVIMLSGVEVNNHKLSDKGKIKLDDILKFISSNEFDDFQALSNLFELLRTINEYQKELNRK